MQYPNGDVITYHYYDNGKLKSVTDADGKTTSYVYDGNGRVKEQNNSNGTTDTYTYDAVGQLISQQDGNIASVSSVTMTYDAANRIKTYNGEEVTYDKEGNMTYGPSTEGIMTAYTYNCRNQLIQADNVTYEYDAEGNRTAQIDVETGTRTEYVNNTNSELTQVVMETATCAGKTSTTTYVYGNGLVSQNSSSEGINRLTIDSITFNLYSISIIFAL